jgi:undecaprenyl-diphosphatase
MLTHWMRTITEFGDAGIVLAIAAACGAWLWRRRSRQAALVWAVAVLGCVVSMVALKLGFYTGDLSVSGVALRNPSGHAALSMMVYGGAAWITAGQLSDWRRPFLLLLGAAAVAAIAVSRRYLHFHSASDVVVGVAVGAFWAALFLWYGYRRDPPARGNPLPLMLVLAVIALVTYGNHLPVGRMAALFPLPPGFAAQL